MNWKHKLENEFKYSITKLVESLSVALRVNKNTCTYVYAYIFNGFYMFYDFFLFNIN